MRFTLVKDPARIAHIQQRLADRHEQMMKCRGGLVCCEPPALPNVFPRLSRILDGSPHRTPFHALHYHIRSADRKIERLIPAADYYKFVFRAVADKRYTLELGLGRIRELEQWMGHYYRGTPEPTLRTERPSFRVVDHVYALKAELGNILFVARGTLDTVASLFHFLYGPDSPQFTSFSAFVRHLNQSRRAGADPDPPMREYIAEHLAWFQTLREYRNYVTHYASIDISFYEPEEGVVRTYLQDALQGHDVVAPVLAGLDAFCEFVDGHFAARIREATDDVLPRWDPTRSAGAGSAATPAL